MHISKRQLIALGGVFGVLLAAYLPLIQRIPNGADHYFMIDAGETQIVLNNWGTLHATGYPHYVMLGNLLTAPLRAVGVSPAAAAAGVSLMWGILATTLIFALAAHLGRSAFLAAAMTTAYGLTRTVWIHNVIAEIYTFGLLILAGLLALALWRGEVGGWRGSPNARIYWLALLGGVGVAHHRALGMAAPALLLAVWPLLARQPRRAVWVLVKSLGLGLLGFVPYLYLVGRARVGADWVYGAPGTLAGLWAQVSGAEASRFIGPPGTLAGLWANLTALNRVLLTDLTLAGLVLGLVGLVAGVASTRHRRAAVVLAVSGGTAYGFHALFYTDILSALVLPVTLSLAFGWLFGADLLLRMTWARDVPIVPGHRWAVGGALSLMWVTFALVAVTRNIPFIQGLTTDPRGLEAIELAAGAPPGSVLMLPWGPLHFAVGYAVDISGELDGITLVDHQADYTAPAAERRLIVPEYVQYRYPLSWWEAQVGGQLYPSAAGPGLVMLPTEPNVLQDYPVAFDAVARQEQVTCQPDGLRLDIVWLAPALPPDDLSVFVHLLDADGQIIAQDDRAAPVYGWRPMSSWRAGELIHDVYTLPRPDAAAVLRYGAYQQTAEGGFVNAFEYEIEVNCAGA